MFRYSIALSFILVLPPLLMFWLVVHPFIRFWRRLGLWWTYGLTLSAMFTGGVAIFLVRGPLLAVDFGENHGLETAGAMALLASVLLRIRVGKRISFPQIVGVPEIDPGGHPGKLLTEGIYAQIRHPRYVQVVLGLAGGALIANYPAAYIAAALWLPGVWIITQLEEKELIARFGKDYEDYRRRVPGFVPKLRPTTNETGF
jgi:protein-S-isoprenylcysteine O-methyltransferase Ste14